MIVPGAHDSGVTIAGALVEQTRPGQPIITLAGQQVALGPMNRDQLPLYLKWNNDLEVLRTTSGVRVTSIEALEREYERISTSQDEVHFTIYERDGLRPIGGVNLHFIRYTHHGAQFGIAIGEKDCWGKGYGTEAT